MKYTVRDACDIAYKKITAGKVRAKVILIVLQGSLKNPNYWFTYSKYILCIWDCGYM